jgi:hypothetical protein
MALGSSQYLTEMSTGNISGVKVLPNNEGEEDEMGGGM